MRKILLTVQLIISTIAYGQKVEMTWNEETDGIDNHSEIPVVDVDYEDEKLTVDWNKEDAHAIVLVTDECGNTIYSDSIVLSRQSTSLYLTPPKNRDMRVDIYVKNNHFYGYIQKEDAF